MGLTEKEKDIMDHLLEAYDLFRELPVQHQDDMKDFHNDIHRLQRIIATRSARRANPSYWRVL